MSPGTALAEARRQAGLTVAEVSQQTRIRESIIRGIEQDDYAACGGDFYARGHIRAMARVVGTDPVPLIEEYDAVQAPPFLEGPPFPEGPPEGVGPDRPLAEPDGPGTGSGWRGGPGTSYRPDGAPAPPADLGLPYMTGGFRPLPADPGTRRDPEPGHGTLRPPIPPYDTGNVRPLPADPGAPEDNDAGRRRVPDQDAAPGPGPASTGRTPPSPPARKAPTVYSFTDASVAPDPGPADPGPADPGPADPGPADPSPTSPSPPAGTTPTVYSFSDPSAAGFGPDQASQVPPDPPADPAPGSYSFTDPGTLRFSDLDEYDMPGGRFFSEPGTADDAEPEWATADGQPEWNEPGTDQTEWNEPGTDQTEWNEPDATRTELTGLDALFGRPGAQPPPGGATTSPRGHPGGPAAGGWPGHRTPGGPLAAPPPTSPPPRPRPRRGAAPARPPGRPAGPAAWRPGGQHRPNRTAIVLIGLLVVIGVLSYVLLSGSGAPPRSRPAAAASPSTHASASHHPSPTGTPSSSPSPSSTPTQTLHPARAVAFGPGGLGHGDNPQEAGLAIDGRRGTSWSTDWYSNSHFGNLQNGTGLLLNMGRRVTVSSVAINLGHGHGARLQIRAGDSAAPGSLRTVARDGRAGPGGVVRVRLSSPAHARFLLIWFTTLPQDAAGTYEVKIYNVIVRGTS